MQPIKCVIFQKKKKITLYQLVSERGYILGKTTRLLCGQQIEGLIC
jgi:hypothetical protein